MFVVSSTTRGEEPMKTNQEILLSIIRENDNPEQALQIAVDIITTFLKQCESSQEPSVGSLQELG